MASQVQTPDKSTVEAVHKLAQDNTPKEAKITVTVASDQQAVVLNADTMAIIDKMYTSQDDIANESKYIRSFIHGAVVAGAKQECRRLQNVWENAITKENKLHPTWSREQAETELLQSKKMKEFKSLVDVAVSLLKTEFK
jgi:hypothetical protein